MERIKITARIGGGPVIMQGLALSTPFDSILAWAAIDKAEETLRRRVTQEEADNVINSLPLKKISLGAGKGFLYAASIPSFAGMTAPYDRDITIYKAMTLGRMLGKTDDQKTLAWFGQSGGPWKTSAPTYSPIMAQEIAWTADGDLEAVRELLSGITHIGKKRSIGYGRLIDRKLLCEPADPGTPVRRFLPVEYFPSVSARMAIPVVPPYWQTDTKVLCGIGDV